MTTARALGEAVKANFLDLSGGELNGQIVNAIGDLIRQKTNDKWTSIKGGKAHGEGGYFTAYGKDLNNGNAVMGAHNGTNGVELVLQPNGNLTLGGKKIVRSVNGSTADASGNVEVAMGDALSANSRPHNVIASTSEDTVTKWLELGAGTFWFSSNGHLLNQPSQFGFVLNIILGGDVFQIFKVQCDGDLYYRGGNSQGWGSAWKRIVGITSSWRSGENWYRKWSDGTIEQGGILWFEGSSGTITYHTPYTQANPVVDYNTINNGHGEYTLSSVAKTSFTWQSNVHRSGYLFWRASGY